MPFGQGNDGRHLIARPAKELGLAIEKQFLLKKLEFPLNRTAVQTDLDTQSGVDRGAMGGADHESGVISRPQPDRARFRSSELLHGGVQRDAARHLGYFALDHEAPAGGRQRQGPPFIVAPPSIVMEAGQGAKLREHSQTPAAGESASLSCSVIASLRAMVSIPVEIGAGDSTSSSPMIFWAKTSMWDASA